MFNCEYYDKLNDLIRYMQKHDIKIPDDLLTLHADELEKFDLLDDIDPDLHNHSDNFFVDVCGIDPAYLTEDELDC